MEARLRKPSMTFAAISLLAGCGGMDHMGGDDVNALGQNIQSARLEVARHQNAITAASSLTDVPSETDRHDRAMSDITYMMDNTMGAMMSHCSGPGMGTMHDRIGNMGSEMQSDREAMLNAGTLPEAREECTAHTHRMNGMLDEMQQSLGNMGCMMGR